MSLWIKICGNTSLEDALLAAEAGADALGFVFAPSPRRMMAAQVAAIIAKLPEAVEKIGVFVDAGTEEIASAVAACGLTGVQLHFDAPPELPAGLRARFGPDLRILRVVHFAAEQAAQQQDLAWEHSLSNRGNAIRIGSLVSGHGFSRAEDAAAEEGALAPEACFSDANIDAILVDSRTATATGGTGRSFDWELAARTLFRDAHGCKLVAAGGLTPGNVAGAIATLRPWGVDAVSGVESAPGRKDPAKVRAFIAAARAAERK